MKRHLIWFSFFLAACANGAGDPDSVDTQVSLLVPAQSAEARALGVVGWELHMGSTGLQLSGIDADNRRFGSALFALREHAGRDGALLLVQAKLGRRGQLAYAADGTVLENTLGDVPGAPAWFGAVHADLGTLVGAGLTPYTSMGDCVFDGIGTAIGCAEAVGGIALCGPTSGVGCVAGIAGGVYCGRGLESAYRCMTGTEAPSGIPDPCYGSEWGESCSSDTGAGTSDGSDSAGGDSGSDPSGSDPSDDGSEGPSGSDPSGSDGSGSAGGDGGSDPSGSDPWDDGSEGPSSEAPPADTGAEGDGSSGTDDGSSADDFSGEWGGSDFGGADSDTDGWEDDWDSGSSSDSWGDSSDTSWDDGGDGFEGGGGADDYGY